MQLVKSEAPSQVDIFINLICPMTNSRVQEDDDVLGRDGPVDVPGPAADVVQVRSLLLRVPSVSGTIDQSMRLRMVLSILGIFWI